MTNSDLKLPHAKSAYNRGPSYTTMHSPFECVYGVNPPTPIDLLPIPSESSISYDAEVRAKKMKRLHEHSRRHIEEANAANIARASKHRKQL